MEKTKSLRFILSIFVVTITVITSGCIFLITSSIYIQSNRQNITNLLQAQANREAAILDYKLNFAGRTAVNLADVIEAMPVYDEKKTFREIDKKLKNDKLLFGMGVWFEPYQIDKSHKYYGPYMYRDDQGKNIFTWEYNTPPYDYFNWDWYKVVFGPKKSDIFFSRTYFDGVMNTFFLTGSSPIIKDDRIIGVATADISIREVADYVRGIKVGYNGYGFVLTNNGYIIGDPPFVKKGDQETKFKLLKSLVDIDDPWTMEYINLENKVLLSKGSGITELTNHDQMASFTKIGDTGLSLVLIYPQRELYSSFYRTLGCYFLLAFLIAGFLLLFIRVCVKSIIERPVTDLLEKVNRIMNGNFSRDGGSNGERPISREFYMINHAVDQMSESLDKLVWDLNRQNAELLASRKTIEINEEKYRHLAYYDILTDLPNRACFNEEIRELINNPAPLEKFAVFFMDLDNFKGINDTSGHSTGDQVLAAIARKLMTLTEERISVFRFGGDEFILIARTIQDPEDCRQIAAKVHRLVNEPIWMEDNVYYINVSIGISIYPEDGTNLDELLRNADTAMFEGKVKGGDCSTFFDIRMNESIMEKTKMEKKLRSALEKGEFVLYYQPLVDLKEKRICSFEALVRWVTPDEGIIPPERFIRLAEDSRLIIPLGFWIMTAACSFIRRLMDAGNDDIRVAVNVSVIQMMESSFADMVLYAIATANIPPDRLVIEITESKLMESYEDCIHNITRLRQVGVGFAIDDFGSGYSSFSYLKHLPATTVKIDKYFIDHLSPDDAANLTEVIIIVGHKMGLNVVAEGVETRTQYQMLEQFGCDIIQGYLISRPLPEENIEKFMIKWRNPSK